LSDISDVAVEEARDAAIDQLDRFDAVSVAYVNSNQVSYSWHHSMVEMIGWDLANHARIMRGGYVAIRHGSGGLIEARNMAVREFLDNHQADWLFWIDTDMGFAADTVDRLVAAADPVERPIVGGLCFAQREMNEDGVGGWRCSAAPTLFDWLTLKDEQGFAIHWDYPNNTLMRVAGTGSACILIHRTVFEQIEDKFGPAWYNRAPNIYTGQLISEDLSFCVRAGALDIPIHVHTGIRTTHHKAVWLSEEDYWRQRAVDPPPPAPDETTTVMATKRSVESDAGGDDD
jgi:hypothetical protein